MTNIPSTEERIWAVLSHLSAITLGMGILLPVIGWSEQRRKSNYAAFQCLQALGYQSLGFTVWILSYLVLMVVFFISMLVLFGITGEGGNNFGVFMATRMSLFLIVVFGFFGIYLLFPVIAGIACALGKDFRYPILGKRLAPYLGYDTSKSGEGQNRLIEDHEDRWVAAMGHFSVIIMLWGMLAPLTAWILQGKRSLFLKFQSIQTLVYQTGVTLLFFAAGIVYMFGFITFVLAVGLDSGRELSRVGIVGLILFGFLMLIAFAIILIVPLFHILGQWAGYRVLKGDDYHYPLIGRMVGRRLASSPQLQSIVQRPVDASGEAS